MNLGGLEILIILIVTVAALIPLVALISVLMHPQAEFDALGQSKGTWVILLVLGVCISLLGMIIGVYYLLTVRPKLGRPATH